MVVFELDGLVPAKKNSRSLFFRDGKQQNQPSAKYLKWHKTAAEDLTPQLFGLPMPLEVEPLYIAYKFTMPDYVRRDLSNMIQSIEDLLKDMGLITDDAWKYLQIAGAVAHCEPKQASVQFAIEDDIKTLQEWLTTQQH